MKVSPSLKFFAPGKYLSGASFSPVGISLLYPESSDYLAGSESTQFWRGPFGEEIRVKADVDRHGRPPRL